jgi:predicted Zn finger-like uncharacterized protein
VNLEPTRQELPAQLELCALNGTFPSMKKSDITCPKCKAGYRRIELMTSPGIRGEFRCLTCNHLLEVFDGSATVALRLTAQPERTRSNGNNPFSN